MKMVFSILFLLLTARCHAQVEITPISTEVGPRGIVEKKVDYRRDIGKSFFDFRKTIALANESKSSNDIYPVEVRTRYRYISVVGLTVIGVQPESLTWTEMKSGYDGDGLRMQTSGHKATTDCFIKNVSDGLSPRGSGTWSLSNSWMVDIRDDAIENDQVLSGSISNCLFDGVFMFLSARPNWKRGPPEGFVPPIVTIDDCLIYVKPFPDDEPKTRYDDGNGNAHGQFFKWSKYGGKVVCRNCVFRMDQYAARGPAAMGWPEGEYENCTLVWLGEGDYPRDVPEGVTVTTDLQFWIDRRTDWIIENSWRFPNRHILKDINIIEPIPEQPSTGD